MFVFIENENEFLKNSDFWYIWFNDHIQKVFEISERSTVDGFIFVGTDFHGLKKNQTFVGFKILGHSIFLSNSYRKLKIGTPGIFNNSQ